jgi:hypothetical protein
MRLPVFLLGFASVFATAARGDDDCRCWTPSAAQVSELEDLVRQKIPAGELTDMHRQPTALDKYARHYAGVTEDGHQIVRGIFVLHLSHEKTAGVYILKSEIMLPRSDDGACGVVNVTYDVSSKALIWRCNGPHLFTRAISGNAGVYPGYGYIRQRRAQ